MYQNVTTQIVSWLGNLIETSCSYLYYMVKCSLVHVHCKSLGFDHAFQNEYDIKEFLYLTLVHIKPPW